MDQSKLVKQNSGRLDNRQLFALKELMKWRDATAREDDEGACYVLPNKMLVDVAEKLPNDKAAMVL